MISVHDRVMIGYLVDGKRRCIVIHTDPPGGATQGAVDVVFNGVVAYEFVSDCFENILFEIEEVATEDIVGDGELFRTRHAQSGWPRDWDSRYETPASFLTRMRCRCFRIGSSYGMEGWVAAARMELVTIADES